jgi:signal transduction histidine kinase
VSLVRGEGDAAGGADGRPAAGGTLRMRVEDTGPGITDSDRGRLFERYARGALLGGEGTGLGLYVARELARANGGDLVLCPLDRTTADQAAGDPNVVGVASGRIGATFTLTLPAESPTEG